MKLSLRIVLIISSTGLLVACSNSTQLSQNSSNANKPNVLYIHVDDLGYKDLGFMGSEYYETPHIDALAKSGMIFTQGYASAANCAPSRACLMSGQNTPRHGIYTVSNSERGNTKTRRIIPTPNTLFLTDEQFTLAELFKRAGYATGTFGKWHVTKDPLQDGFDVNIGGTHAGSPGKDGYFAPYNDRPGLAHAPEGEHLTDRLTSEAISFLEQNKEKPFFLYLPYYAVHTPLMGKAELIEKYKRKGMQTGQGNPVYAAMVETLDTNIGKLMEKLDKLGLRENTLIVFTSDNGGIRAISTQHPLRAGKGSYYEGGIRVPYIFSWKGKIKGGTSSSTPITNMDIFPTCMQMLNMKLENKVLDGNSLLPVLHGGSIPDRTFFWHFPIYLQAYSREKDDGRDSLFRTRPGSVILDGKWKLHQYFEDGGIELYNLAEDIGERNNVAELNPTKAAELLEKLNTWRTEMNAPVPREKNPDFDPDFVPKGKNK